MQGTRLRMESDGDQNGKAMKRTRTASALLLACAVCVVEASCSSPDSGREMLLSGKPTAKGGSTSSESSDDPAAGAGGEGAGDANGKEPSGGGSAPNEGAGGQPSTGAGDQPSTSDGGAKPAAPVDQPRQADDCYIYCERRSAAGCLLDYTLGECIDIACAVYSSGLPPACVDAWVAYYVCRLSLDDICVAESCPDPVQSGVCPAS